MKRQLALLVGTIGISLAIVSPARLSAQQATDPVDHSAHHPDTPVAQAAAPVVPGPTGTVASAAKLNQLLKKMQSAKGTAKTDAMAELLTALVQDRQACEPMMASMMKMMETMGRTNGTMPMTPGAK
jgi:hypothetical protein